MADHAKGVCPTCGSASRQVQLSAPPLMVEMMADAGCPGAFHTSGDRIEKRHRASGQYHTSTKAQAREAEDAYRDFVKGVTVTKASEANTKEG